MTLSEITSLVCDKVGKTDTESQDFVKACIKRRYQLIWDAHLWKDSLATATVSTQATGALTYYQDQLILPHWMERPLAVRDEDTTLSDVELIHLFLTDPERFEREERSGRWSRLPSCASRRFLTEECQINFVVLNAADDNTTIFVRDDAERGSGAYETVTVRYGTTVEGGNEYVLPAIIGKPATTGKIEVYADDTDALVTELLPGETQRLYPRIRLHGIPEDSSMEYLVLGKKKCPGLQSDYDLPAIQNVDDALIAFAQSDLLERCRQYGKAQAKVEEGRAQLEKARNLEIQQGTNTVRLVPVVEPSYYDNELTKNNFI
jgi:hypothetical protein